MSDDEPTMQQISEALAGKTVLLPGGGSGSSGPAVGVGGDGPTGLVLHGRGRAGPVLIDDFIDLFRRAGIGFTREYGDWSEPGKKRCALRIEVGMGKVDGYGGFGATFRFDPERQTFVEVEIGK